MRLISPTKSITLDSMFNEVIKVGKVDGVLANGAVEACRSRVDYQGAFLG